jgi:hypothetical protein
MALLVVNLSGCLAATPSEAPSSSVNPTLARQILADPALPEVLGRARALVGSGLSAGYGYREVWIRDLNSFIELALPVSERDEIRRALVTFLQFQGPQGEIVDGYVPRSRARVAYEYRSSELAPDLLAHKNTVETDQESSLVQAVARYVGATGDADLLQEEIGGVRVVRRLEAALVYLLNHRLEPEHGLLWGATTVDWGDVQPEEEWGVALGQGSHRALDVYDNAMFVVAIEGYLTLVGEDGPGVDAWARRRDELRQNIRKHLWDGKRQKFLPHVYLEGSPFPEDFDESAIWYHGGTAVAIEAGVLSRSEIRSSLERMRENAREAGASSIGLTVYPPYPPRFFKNPAMAPWQYQNGGDWSWFGGRMIQQLIRHGFVEEAYQDLRPMVARVLEHGDFREWWTRENEPRGARRYRASAGAVGRAVEMLLDWAEGQDVG